jgi:uncharacterized protein involved in type VI secretion and phage assembly
MMARMIEMTTPVGKGPVVQGAPRARGAGAVVGVRGDGDLGALRHQPERPSRQERHREAGALKGGTRYFNGYVTRFTQGGLVGRQFEYRMMVRSWLWFLTRTTDCKIFQDKSVPDIIKEVFADHPVAVFEAGLNASYAQRKYCVQYRETDFDFVSRLMEEEGIYYYFEHSDGKHTLKLVDSDSGHKTLENKATIAYYQPGRGIHVDEEHIQALTFRRNIQPGAVALQSFDFEKPKADLGVKSRLLQPHERADYEVFDWAGDSDYIQADHGDHYVKLRVDELHADFERLDAECNVRDIVVGRLFKLTNAPRRIRKRLPDRQGRIRPAEQHVRNQHQRRRDLPLRDDGAPEPPAVSSGSPQPPAHHGRPPDGGRRRTGRRGDLLRQVRPGQGAVPLGPLREAGTRTRAAGSASPTRGPGPTGAGWRFRAWARRSSSTSWRAIPTSRSSLGASTTRTRCRRTRCRPT